jgi:hypothetical protein
MTPFVRSTLAAAAVALLLAGCAGPRIDGQWTDPAFESRSLAGRTVLVSCRGPDGTLARLCEDRLATGLREAGTKAVFAPQPIEAAGGSEAVARAAREAGADFAVTSSVSVAAVAGAAYPMGPSIGFGLGGGFGGGGLSFGGIGMSMSVPIGGTRPQSAYGSSTAVLDPVTGREMWSVRATSSAASDAAVQIAELARTSVEAMRRSGLFEAR